MRTSRKPAAIVNLRTGTEHAVLCVPSSNRISSRWLWNTLFVVIPLLDDANLLPCARACEDCYVTFQLDRHAAKGDSSGSGGQMRGGSKKRSDRLGTPQATAS